MKTRRIFEFLVAMGAATAIAHGQSVISARSGVIHLAEGDVYLSDKLVQPKFGEFPELKAGGVLRSEDGRAEVLLTPGVFLRMGENSSFRMVKNKLEDTQVELIEGAVLVECAELLENNSITFTYKDYSFTPKKAGLFRIDLGSPERVRVYEGEVLVAVSGSEVKVKRGKQLLLAGGTVLAKFDPKVGDPLFRWSKNRAGSIAMANLYAAKSLADSGNVWRTGGWYYNPYFGLMTYIPLGYLSSPFGYGYYGPRTVYRAYAPPQQQRPPEMGMGGGGMGGYGPSYSGVGRSVNSATSVMSGSSGGGYNTAAPSGGGQSAARSADSATGRGSSGGRGR